MPQTTEFDAALDDLRLARQRFNDADRLHIDAAVYAVDERWARVMALIKERRQSDGIA